jgi:superfamily II DNA or RNA helicase
MTAAAIPTQQSLTLTRGLASAPAPLALRPYQSEALAAINEAKAAGKGKALIVLPTGTGKTILFNSLISTWRVSTVILAHREELLTQARDKLLAVWPDADVGIVGAGYNQPGHLVTIGSVQSLSKPKRLSALSSSAVGLIIVDECHHVAAASYKAVLRAVRAGEQDGAFHVGVTATPDRADGRSIVDGTYGDPVYLAMLPEMIRANYLVNLRGVQVRTTTRLDEVKTRAGDFAEDELAALVNREDRNTLIVEAWQKHAADRQTLVFCASVAHAHDLAETFREAGIAAEALDGKTPHELRKAMLARVASGATQVICNCGVLTEGFDSPSISCVVMARPTQSRSLFVQCVGRGTRPAPGKSDCLILDVADVSTKHKLVLQNLPRLAGRLGYMEEEAAQRRAGRVKGDADTGDDAGAFDMREALDRAPAGAGRVIERAIDLLDGFTWEPADNGHYKMAIEGKATFWLVYRDGGYVCGVVWADGHKQELTGSPVSLDWAQTIAERSAVQVTQDQQHLVDRRAPWRFAAPSDKQLYTLRKLRIRYNPALTRGEAADLITAAFARQPRSA